MKQINKPSWLSSPNLWTPQSQTDDVPTFQCKEGKFCTTGNKITGLDTSARAYHGGITHWQSTSVDAKIQLLWQHSVLFQNAGKPSGTPYGAANLTERDCINVAQTITLADLLADEFGEGPFWMMYNEQQRIWYYQALQERFKKEGIKYTNIGPYGDFCYMQPNNWEYFDFMGGNQVMPNDPRFKAFLQSRKKARNGSQYYFDNFEPLGLGSNIKNYIDRPDYCHLAYMKIFETEAMALGHGKVGGVGPGIVAYVDWPMIEGLGNNLGGGHFHSRRVKSPNPGFVDMTDPNHAQVDHDWRVGLGFICGYVLGSGWVQFTTPETYTTDPKTMSTRQRWVPDEPGKSGPTTKEAATFGDYFFAEQVRGYDAAPEAHYYYTKMDKTVGNRWRYVPFRYEGSEKWIMPETDQGPDKGPTSTILERASDFDGPYARKEYARRGGPIAMVRDDGSTVHGFGFDPSRHKFSSETIILRPTANPDKQVSMTLKGSTLFPFEDTVS